MKIWTKNITRQIKIKKYTQTKTYEKVFHGVFFAYLEMQFYEVGLDKSLKLIMTDRETGCGAHQKWQVGS